MAEKYEIPSVIPEVVFDRHGEPIIAREIVLRPSPVPKMLAIIMVLFAGLSLGIVIYSQDQRNDATDLANQRIAQVQVKQAEDIERVRQLVIALLKAKNEPERRKILETYTRQSAADKKADAKLSPRSPVPSDSPDDVKPSPRVQAP